MEEDIPELPQWNKIQALRKIQQNPLDAIIMKNKLDRIYMITIFNELEYLKDVIDAYTWIRLGNEVQSLSQFLNNQSIQKYYLEQFVGTAIKFMILCRIFKLKAMMSITKQMMFEGLKIFDRYFDNVKKYPNMTNILKCILDIDKQFFKRNFINQYSYLVIPPTNVEIQEVNSFVDSLQAGNRVDVLKIQDNSKRLCWLPGTVVEIQNIYIHVKCDDEQKVLIIEQKSMLIRPFQSMKTQYEWRFNLKAGDQIDFFSNYTWAYTTVQDIIDIENGAVKFTNVKIKNYQDWLSITDPRIQKHKSVVLQDGPNTYAQDTVLFDFNDLILDPEMKHLFVNRPEGTKSMLFIQLLNFAHKQLNLLNKILQKIKQSSIQVKIMVNLLIIVKNMTLVFHKKFATIYFKQFLDFILHFINNSKEQQLSNFSKEYFESISYILQQILKRFKSKIQSLTIFSKFIFDIIPRLFYSDQLDSRLLAVQQLKLLILRCKQEQSQGPLNQFLGWIKQNKIINSIIIDKNHEFFENSVNFLRQYLQTKPQVQQLQLLLMWDQTLLLRAKSLYQYLPKQLQDKIVRNIKQKQNVTDVNALNIIQKTQDHEGWLIKNNLDSWLQIVQRKMQNKQKIDFQKAIEQPYQVLLKITKAIDQLEGEELARIFYKYLFDCNYLVALIDNENLNIKNNKNTNPTQILTLIQFISCLSDKLVSFFSINCQKNKNYFELWITLVQNNQFVVEYCQKTKFINRILQIIIKYIYPYPQIQKIYPLGTQNYSQSFQHALELIQILLNSNYKLSQEQENKLGRYGFMNIVINTKFKQGASMIMTICQGNRIVSEKMAFLLLTRASNTKHDLAKPIVASIHEFLSIDDELKRERFQWIIGFPIYLQHQISQSYGSYGIYPQNDSIITFVSAIGATSILELIVRNRNKIKHISAIFISMVLQLEKDGLINRLDEYPSWNAFAETFTNCIEKFALSYYEEMHDPNNFNSYRQYSNILKKLWEERPNKQFQNQFPECIIGKTIRANRINQQIFNEIIHVSHYDVESYYLPNSQNWKDINLKSLKKYKGASNFISPHLPQKVAVYRHSQTHNYTILQIEDQNQEEQNSIDTIFQNTQQGFILRKIVITNKSIDDLVIIVIFTTDSQECNIILPRTPLRLQIKSQSSCNITFIKKDITKGYGKFEIKIQILGKAIKDGYWPRRIITKHKSTIQNNQSISIQDEEDPSESWY